MSEWYAANFAVGLIPALLMVAAALRAYASGHTLPRHMWRTFNALALLALAFAAAALVLELLAAHSGHAVTTGIGNWLAINQFGTWVSLLVQLLGAAIGIYSSKHLEGEPRQRVYIAALAAVLASVHLLLLANHWVVLIAAWAAIEWAMHYLLCFYRDRPFALLAAHKKMVTDRGADVLLVIAALLAWREVGSGSLTDLWAYLAAGHASPTLAWSGVCLALAVIARTALMPVHGWLVQVMEAPTPVSALLHAGVVNLGGYVLVLFAPLLGVALAARWLLVVFGLVSAVVAGLVLLTRVSQKVHLAWSTIAQMGFMLLECGLGLYLFAALHLLGHSLYKAHNFLNASSAVKETSRKLITGEVENSHASMLLAVPVALAIVLAFRLLAGNHAWPWWWAGVLALAWAPLLWVPKASRERTGTVAVRLATALGTAVALTVAACLVDRAPIGASEAPLAGAGIVALVGMTLMYLEMVAFQVWPHAIRTLRRWVYAGFYMDEGYTHWVLRLWPTRWAGVESCAVVTPASTGTCARSEA
ncbi:MAG: NADH-quinone oxidoreductase subunit L [Rhodanobacter sp.]|nr:MAG: NADH-quinone oxidoreductase subunit L [Rhodanobacter sp.]TAM13477.1 MAG: NADH-quinone oxidoreductase subunit L [Rhodanobacter sp.]TAM35770.1 MAG: NADH-quinone oxidoreductase subunit L [Rhodanobacter sp.]